MEASIAVPGGKLGHVQWGAVIISYDCKVNIFLSWRREDEEREYCIPLAK
jgi:hypothetical protein